MSTLQLLRAIHVPPISSTSATNAARRLQLTASPPVSWVFPRMDRGHTVFTVFTVNGQISLLAVQIRSVRRADDGRIKSDRGASLPHFFFCPGSLKKKMQRPFFFLLLRGSHFRDIPPTEAGTKKITNDKVVASLFAEQPFALKSKWIGDVPR